MEETPTKTIEEIISKSREYLEETGSELIKHVVKLYKNGALNIKDNENRFGISLAKGTIDRKQYQKDNSTRKDIEYFDKNIRPILTI